MSPPVESAGWVTEAQLAAVEEAAAALSEAQRSSVTAYFKVGSLEHIQQEDYSLAMRMLITLRKHSLGSDAVPDSRDVRGGIA